MGKDQADPAGQDSERSTPGSGSTIPKSKDGVWATSTPGKSSFEPEEDVQGGEDAGSPEKVLDRLRVRRKEVRRKDVRNLKAHATTTAGGRRRRRVEVG